jgi:hypothetical protein
MTLAKQHPRRDSKSNFKIKHKKFCKILKIISVMIKAKQKGGKNKQM